MLEQALITHASPTLARIKTGSLFNMNCSSIHCLRGEMNRLSPMFGEKGVGLTVLKSQEGRYLMYLYCIQELQRRLDDADIQAFLRSFGYLDFSVNAAIDHLCTRLAESDGFPHEIGVFLGYPLTDIQGFICNEGRNCLCCGYWKVYSYPARAQKLFARYRKCTQAYLRLFAQGCPLSRLTVRTHPIS